jgi:hypothetical protein
LQIPGRSSKATSPDGSRCEEPMISPRLSRPLRCSSGRRFTWLASPVAPEMPGYDATGRSRISAKPQGRSQRRRGSSPVVNASPLERGLPGPHHVDHHADGLGDDRGVVDHDVVSRVRVGDVHRAGHERRELVLGRRPRSVYDRYASRGPAGRQAPAGLIALSVFTFGMPSGAGIAAAGDAVRS